MKILILIFITLNVATIKIISAVPQEAFCCSPGQALLKRNTECWNPLDNKTSPIIQLTCNSTIVIQDSLINFTLLESGHLVTHVEDEYTLYTDPIPVGAFCVANQTNRRDVNIRNATRVMVLCTDEEQDIIDEDILAYCMIVSVIFLCLTALIYALISELRDLHGKSIINLCISLAIGLMILVTIKIVPYQDMKLCAARGFLTYFFIITGFLWMNCISIQILLSIRRPTVSSYGWKEFGIYALYAWGCPAILTISMAIVNYYPGKHHRPGIGLNSCWFFTQTQQWYYMYSVITIILVANICMFIYTSFVLWSQSFKSSTHVKALKYKFTMTLRLCIIMGLPWIFEMITASSKAHIVWVILDIFNTLQGVFIFIVLVILRPRVIKAMHRRGLLCCLSRLFEKHLAVDDDEENIVQHTIIVPMEERA